MRRAVVAVWQALLLGLTACPEPPGQALVELALAPELMAELHVIEVTALEDSGEAGGTHGRLELDADYVQQSRVSFGAIVGVNGDLVLRFRGWDEHGQLRLDQTLRRQISGSGRMHVELSLSSDCLDQLPCPDCGLDRLDRDTGACTAAASDLATTPDASLPKPPACRLGTVLDCGGCGRKCNMSHLSFTDCQSGECIGECEDGWGDCDKSLQSNGCETSLLTDPKHCGGCNNAPCPYGVCVNGICTLDCEGSFYTSEPVRSQSAPPNRMLGMSVSLQRRGILSGLGVHVLRGPFDPDTRFRMALYESDPMTRRPGHLVDQTAETSARALERDYSGAVNECGSGLEMRTPMRVPVESGEYWLFLIAAANLGFEILPVRVELLTSQDDVDYASLEQMPDTADHRSPLRSTFNFAPSTYVVLTPLP